MFCWHSLLPPLYPSASLGDRQLVDLGHTPADIKQKIVDQYDTYEYNQRDKLLNYFVKNKLRNLTEHIGDF